MIGPLILGSSAAFATAAAGMGYAAVAPGCQWYGPVLRRGDPAGPRHIALTFDDGPTPGATDRVLACLDEFNVPACFFCIGRNAERSPGLLRTAHAAGHLLANHSDDHARHGAFHGRRYWVEQLERTNAAVHDAIGRTPKLFRPPMGIKTPRVLYAPITLGMLTVTWTHRGFDTRQRDPARIAGRLTRRLSAGSVLVLHDGTEPGRRRGADATCASLPLIIGSARQAGYTFARLDDVLGVQGYADPD